MTEKSMVLWCLSRRFSTIKAPINLTLILFGCFAGFGCQSQAASDPQSADINDAAVAEIDPAEIELKDVTFATLAPPTIVVVQQTPTPIPTPTSTPTPTPIIYVIQDGDTLLGVALQNQTTVEDILGLNSDVRPELLSIGQEIVLPPPATPVFSGDRPTPVPISVEILSQLLYPDGAGGVWVMGELKNTTERPIENLVLGATLFGPEGTAVKSVEMSVPRKILQPQEISPFGVLIPQKPAGILQADVRLLEGAVALGPEPAGVVASLQDLDVQIVGSVATVTGRVVNEEDFEVQISSILLVLFDGADQIVGFAQAGQSLGQIPAGGSVAFEHQMIPPGKNTIRVEGVVELSHQPQSE